MLLVCRRKKITVPLEKEATVYLDFTPSLIYIEFKFKIA
jgi:hypothetical protein